MASGRQEVSLSLADKRASKSQQSIVLLLACSGIPCSPYLLDHVHDLWQSLQYKREVTFSMEDVQA